MTMKIVCRQKQQQQQLKVFISSLFLMPWHRAFSSENIKKHFTLLFKLSNRKRRQFRFFFSFSISFEQYAISYHILLIFNVDCNSNGCFPLFSIRSLQYAQVEKVSSRVHLSSTLMILNCSFLLIFIFVFCFSFLTIHFATFSFLRAKASLNLFIIVSDLYFYCIHMSFSWKNDVFQWKFVY